MKPAITTGAVLALLASTAIVSAQTAEPKQNAPSAQSGGQDTGGARAPDSGGQDKGPSSKDQKADSGGKADSGERKGKAEGPRRADDQDKGGKDKQRAADQDKAGKDKQRAGDKDKAGPKDKQAVDKDKAAPKDKQAADKDKAAPKDKQAVDKDKAAPKDKQAADKDRGQAKQVELSTEERTRVRQTLIQRNEARVTNVNFSVSIGTRVPRSINLVVLPTVIVDIAPRWRGYRYFVVDDRICIVDPQSYVIVAVIDDGGPRRGGTQTVSLELTADERAYILDHVSFDRARADVRIGLALGAEIPTSVELYTFPDVIVRRVPKVRDYRFVVVDRDVVLVDPKGREVALVINNR